MNFWYNIMYEEFNIRLVYSRKRKSLMITDNKLDIFENFQVNRKPKPKKEEEPTNGSIFVASSDGVTVSTADWGVANGFRIREVVPFRERVSQFMNNFFNPNKYFGNVKKSMQKIETNPLVYDRIQQLHKEASTARQTALVEQLNREKVRVENEAKLIHLGFDTAIDEEDIVLLSQKAPKIHLTWIKNFLRPIPKDVQKKHKKADDTEIFDNFVVMHYGDPKGAIGETEAEVARRKDPILFGVFQESRRLYYIADWEDELCDLTLQKLLELTGMDEEDVKLTEGRVVEEA